MRTPAILIFAGILVLFVNIALADISISTALQRKMQGDSCTFQWSVTGKVTNYVIYNQTNGASVSSNPRVSLKQDNTGSTISMTIINIALWDAGNYTLSVFNGMMLENDSNAVLFIFASGSSSWSQTLGRSPVIEGDTVELTCTYTSTSPPMAYRPRVLYSWYLSKFTNPIQVLSNGSLRDSSGNIASGYITRNNGRTLTIASVQYTDAQNIGCGGIEEGSTFPISWSYMYFYVQYKPVITTPLGSRKFNALVAERVALTFQFVAYPGLISTGNNSWSFVNLLGSYLDIPDGSVVGSYSNPSLSFILPSADYYGRYSYNVSNAIGTTTVTFEVLQPGPPDAPSAFQVGCATHFSILLQWNCMWANFNSRQQYVYTQLREPSSNVLLGNATTYPGSTCFNTTWTVFFTSQIQPDTYYEATVWSANERGSSGITKIGLQSAKVFRFVVSSDSIQINGTRVAIINYRIESGNITRFYVTCCYELTGVCFSSGYFYVNSNIGQANLSIANLPNGTEYVFDFTLYTGGSAYSGLVGLVKGVRVSTTIEHTTPEVPRGDLTAAVIALSVVLGIAVIVIVGILIGFLCWKRRHNIPISNRQPQVNGSGTNQSEGEDFYETMDRQTNENHDYANLKQTQRI